MKFLVIICTAIVLVSCGGGKSGGSINKDTKSDFVMEQDKMKALDTAADFEAAQKPYKGKIIEMKGYITAAKKNVTSAEPNTWVFHLSPTATEEGASYTICHTDTDPTGSIGKQFTVKGKYDGFSLNDSVFY